MRQLIFKSLFIFGIISVYFSFSETMAKEIVKQETATFAAGCFWGVEDFFRKIPGVAEVHSGYSGGSKANPKYDDVSEGITGHAESVEIKFDPKLISFQNLLDYFFKMHDPTTKNRQGNDKGTQYRSAIFYHSDQQKKDAEEFIKKVEKSKAWKNAIITEVSAAGPFYKAEEEHQQYLIKHPGGYDNHYMRSISFDKPVKK
ncbi:MAG: peptide-methionine (S)-S-oxide reductase MsrA [Pseudobdellovibrio sp.]